MNRRTNHRIASLGVLFSLLALNFGTGGVIPARADTGTISESFMNSTAPGWELMGNAVLTKTTVDPDGPGWLRLTSNAQSQTGAAVYNVALSSLNAFEIQFDYASYGGNPGADGIAFYMLDGDQAPTLGGGGGGLGYMGIPGAYFAVGLDEYGGFADRPGPVENIAVREGSSLRYSGTLSIVTGSRSGAKHVRISYYNGHLSVWLAGTQVVQQLILAAPPATLKLGLSAATGAYSNFHEVQNFTAAYTSIDSLRVITGEGTWPCGASWAAACGLQTALSVATSGTQIWVAGGVYKPTPGGDRNATFQLKSGVALYGGFDGVEDASLSERDPAAHASTLSGDLSGNDVGFTNNAENVYHVVTGANGASLDGFTISGGNANGNLCPGSGCAGGMYNYYSSPTVTNVTFSGNHASFGGGMNNIYSSPTLTNVTFSGNSAIEGGGIHNGSSSPILTNVTFSGNSADEGGGMFNLISSSPMLTNVTFSANSAIQFGGGIYNWSSNPQIRNTIFWGNIAPIEAQIYNNSSTPAVSDSVVQGGYAGGTHIISADPVLGVLGKYGGSTQTLPLLAGSSAIDAGDDSVCPASDQRGMPRPQGGQCDIGAFEYHDPIFMVKTAANGKGDCGSWADACTLQSALTYSAGGNGDQIWVAAGIYKPTPGSDRNATFQLKSGVALYGGFDGVEDAALSDRDPAAHVSRLSGDLNGDDVGFTNNAENVYNVVTGADGASLDGFTISGGNANGNGCPGGCGGGMYNYASSPTVTNLIFSGNYATYGGGMFNSGSSATVTNVTFNGNSAYQGGGVFNHSSSPILTNITISGNSAGFTGGGMFNHSSSPILTNITISGNTAVANGGGMYNFDFCHPEIRNTIIWGNTPNLQIINDTVCSPTVSDSVVQGGYAGGTHIISADPMLGPLGNYGGFTQTLPVLQGSSAIDTGNDSVCPAADQRGISRKQGAHCDIGAFEYSTRQLFMPLIWR